MNYLYNKKITYIFGDGRKDKLLSKKQFAKEFFYSYFEFQSHCKELNIIEFKENNNPYLVFVDKILRKVTNLSFYMDNIYNSKNKKLLKNSDIIIATNDRLGLSALPILIPRGKKKYKSFVFVMGLLSNKSTNIIKKFTNKFFLSIFLKTFDKLIFLGKPEYEKAISKYSKHKNKLVFLPFSIDTEFWNVEKHSEKKYDILFIGNDSFRDYEFVLDLATNLDHLSFKIITSQITTDKVKNIENIELINGKWSKNLLSDSEILEIYNKSRLTILPLKNTIQPSGQSVALQSMSAGTPVMITKIDGFWDEEIFENNLNILFVEENNLETWSKKIDMVLNNNTLQETISTNAKNLVHNLYNLDLFHNRFYEIMEETK